MQKMTGQVKTTRHAKGFGFITGDDGLDRFFHVTSMVGDQPLPPEGARVVFVAKEDHRGPAAIQVTPLDGPVHTQQRQSRDDRLPCRKCQRRIVPRLSTYYGMPMRSLCPFCGARQSTFWGTWVKWLIYAIAPFLAMGGMLFQLWIGMH